MKLVIGLGNPGIEYENTRHNVGFIVVANYLGNVSWKEKYNALYYIKDDICFIKPLTYMNNSGDAVIKFVNFYKIEKSDILVIQDDMDLIFGNYRVKKNSSSGGHNGIKSIIKVLNSEEFGRLKIGILTEQKHDAIDFVLGHFTNDEIYLLKSDNF